VSCRISSPHRRQRSHLSAWVASLRGRRAVGMLSSLRLTVMIRLFFAPWRSMLCTVCRAPGARPGGSRCRDAAGGAQKRRALRPGRRCRHRTRPTDPSGDHRCPACCARSFRSWRTASTRVGSGRGRAGRGSRAAPREDRWNRPSALRGRSWCTRRGCRWARFGVDSGLGQRGLVTRWRRCRRGCRPHATQSEILRWRCLAPRASVTGV